MRLLIAYVTGLVFGIGIAISGMANPAKVVNFFDITGHWDPSLGMVMGGALLVTGIGYFLTLRRAAPLIDKAFLLPTKKDIDLRLLGGAATFGIGWGIAGFCPGGALPALGTGNADVVMFLAALSVGILLARLIQSRSERGTAQTS